MAMPLNNLGNLLCVTNDFKQAQAYFEEALEIYRELAKQNPEVYKPYVALTLNNSGILLYDTNDLSKPKLTTRRR